MPMLRIAADLQGRGHHVTMLTGAQYRDRISRCGIHTIDLPLAGQPSAQCGRSVVSTWLPTLMNRLLAGRSEMRSVFIDPMTAQYEALLGALHSADVDAVLCDVAFTGAVPLILSKLRRPPIVVCGVGPLTLSSADTPPFGMAWQPRPNTDYRMMNRFVHHVLFADIQAEFNRCVSDLGSPPSPVFLTDWPVLADRLLQLTIPALEFPRRDLPPSVVFTGPVLPRAESTESPTPGWLTDRPASTVVHVTQGTWNNDDPADLIRPTLDALGQRSDLLLVVTTGRPGQTTVPGRVPSNTYITDYLPYSELLPYVDVMITNGGYGGVHEALSHGIPLIIAGGSADKPEVAARVRATGAGITLDAKRLSPSRISIAVDDILSNARYRAAARVLAADIAETNAFDTIADTLTGFTPEHRPVPLRLEQ
ncbi:glycosyltransferase [Mycobacterium sp. JS623]|uniref:glycosyltransferase n=1 Tax=Mycobacterium sp. JS623 TaxID=212767 RepID=UPI001E33F446|nr:glycosyltransferase [Mycobacterium sp. JS623]